MNKEQIIMKAIILAGGYGTRLQPITLRTPKGILPIADSTILELTINQIKDIKFEKIIVSISKMHYKIKEYLDAKFKDLKIEYLFEDTNKDADKLGAIGALSKIIKKYGNDDYLILGSDNYIKGLDYHEMIKMHKEKQSDATIALYELNDVTKVSYYGIAVIDKNKKIIFFQEKPKVEEANSKLASTFNYIITKEFSKKIINYVTESLKNNKKPDNVGDLWENYLNTQNIYGFEFRGEWGDVGKPLPYIEVHHKALDTIKRSLDRSIEFGNNVKVSGNVIIKKGCQIKDNVIIIGPCYIDENVIIQENSIIGPYTSILHDSIIGKNNMINGSIIFEKVKTFSDVKITRALIDGECQIKEHNKIEEQAMIGYGCIIKESSQVLYNTKLWPFLTIDKNSIINGKVFYELNNMIFESKVNNSKYWN